MKKPKLLLTLSCLILLLNCSVDKKELTPGRIVRRGSGPCSILIDSPYKNIFKKGDTIPVCHTKRTDGTTEEFFRLPPDNSCLTDRSKLKAISLAVLTEDPM